MDFSQISQKLSFYVWAGITFSTKWEFWWESCTKSQTWKKLQAVQAALTDILLEDIMSQISSTFDWGWRRKSWRWRLKVAGLRTEDLEFKIEIEGLWIEDCIMPHQHLIHIFLFLLCRESHYFQVCEGPLRKMSTGGPAIYLCMRSLFLASVFISHFKGNIPILST